MRARHLYVHVPFCARRCIYCDFSIAVRPRVPVQDYVETLAGEWDQRQPRVGPELDTLYFGGGTPSKLGADGIARLLEALRRRVTLHPEAEVTLEANPEDVSVDAARAWLTAGINRISLGIQSFDDRVLQWMHRTHDSKAALAAVEVLRDVGLVNLSIDLIFAAPSSISRGWQNDVEMALQLRLQHVSVYGLTVEPHTPLGRWMARRDLIEAPEDRFETEFLAAHELLTASGLEHYEVSNYGAAGLQSRHNWAYWQRKAYGGLGPSAHEFDGRSRAWNVSGYADWVTRVARGSDTRDGSEQLTDEQVTAEELYLGLRTNGGVVLLAGEADYAAKWVEVGWATIDSESTLRLTATGWLRLDALASDLTRLRSR